MGSVGTPLLCVGRAQCALMRLFGDVLEHATLGTLEPQNLGSMRPLLGTCGTRSLTRKPVQPIPQFQCSITVIHGSSATPSGAAYYVRAFIPSMARSTVFLHVEITARAGCGIQRHNYPLNSIRSLGLQNNRGCPHHHVPSQLTVAWTRHGAREMGGQDIKEIILLSAFRS